MPSIGLRANSRLGLLIHPSTICGPDQDILLVSSREPDWPGSCLAPISVPVQTAEVTTRIPSRVFKMRRQVSRKLPTLGSRQLCNLMGRTSVRREFVKQPFVRSQWKIRDCRKSRTLRSRLWTGPSDLSSWILQAGSQLNLLSEPSVYDDPILVLVGPFRRRDSNFS